MRKSVWSETVNLPEFESLKGEIKTDVLVIGGGMCGILCAYYLKEAGVDCVLVEADKIASGITKNTTAKITSLHGAIYGKLIKDVGREKAEMYLYANQNALYEYENLCKNFDCDFEKKLAYTYTLSDRQKIEDEVKSAQILGMKNAFFSETSELPFKTEGSVCFPDQAQFHPLKFIKEIVNDLKIYENTFIRDITPKSVMCDNGKISTNKIIVATHFPFINKHGAYFLKLYQHRSYVSAFENAQKLDGMYVDEDKKGMSYKSYNNLLFIGGEGHRTGKESLAWQGLNNFAKKYYPESELKYEWATQDTMSLDGIPYIGNYSKNTPNLYVATGFNKWGMTSSMASALILRDLIVGKKNDFSEVFNPSRSILKPQLFVNGVESTKNLLMPTPKRCPHLGCALKWNKQEHSWDCPCHGSRFDENGKIIDNPATGNARVK